MKLRIFTFILLSTFATQTAETMPREWKLVNTTKYEDGTIIEQYHLSTGPEKKPLDIKILEYIAPALFCCKRSVKKHITEYPDSYIETIEINPQTGETICKQYFHYK